jgi:hypothetical protein
MRPRSSGENIFVFSRTFGLLGTSAELLQKSKFILEGIQYCMGRNSFEEEKTTPKKRKM